MYIPLKVRSPYSLLRGMVRYHDMVEFCHQHQLGAIGIADTANLYGALDFSLHMVKHGIQPVLGVEIGLQPETITLDGWSHRDFMAGHVDYNALSREGKINTPTVHLIAQTSDGYQNLLGLINIGHYQSAQCAGALPLFSRDQIVDHSAGLICVIGTHDAPFTSSWLDVDREKIRLWLEPWKKAFADRLYMALCRQHWETPQGGANHADQTSQSSDHQSSDYQSSATDNTLVSPRMTALMVETDQWVCDIAYDQGLPLLAVHNAFFPKIQDAKPFHVLSCIGKSQTLSAFENSGLAQSDRWMWSPEEMIERFSDIPEALDNTGELVKRVSFALMASPHALLPKGVDPNQSDTDKLASAAREGLGVHLASLNWRTLHAIDGLADVDEKVYYDRLAFELDVISQVGYAAYFLIVADFVNWSRREGIPVGPGRGSGGGSIVAWCLGITLIDPIRYKLVFERFLNPERVSLPDFDIDFCVEGRDKVVEYVRQRYGQEKVAQIITFGSLGARAVVRDVARVLGVPYGVADRVCRRLASIAGGQFFSLRELATANDRVLNDMINDTPEVQDVLNIAKTLEGLYRHTSTHAGGVIIADRSLRDLVPIHIDPNSKAHLVGFNMKMTEAIGLVKFDLLGLKTLTSIQHTIDLIKRRPVHHEHHTGAHSAHVDTKNLTIETIPLDDPHAFTGMCKGETFAIFQLESEGMRETVVNLKPDQLEDIIAILSLYRPGPMRYIPTYIARRHAREEVKYPHPLLEPILRDTLGIVIYQEQVLEIARYLAGFSFGRADLLRRAIGKKIRKEMTRLRAEFIEGAKVTSNLNTKEAENLYNIIEQFADYGFNRAHAAGYAMIAYYTAWLKTYYPHEFMAASMSLDYQRTDRLLGYTRALKAMDISLLPPDINHSYADFVPQYHRDDGRPYAICFGLAALKNVGKDVITKMITERSQGGDFTSLGNWLDRVAGQRIGVKTMETLVCSGTLDSIAKTHQPLQPHQRGQMLSKVDLWVQRGRSGMHGTQSIEQSSLFSQEEITPSASLDTLLDRTASDWSQWQILERENQAFGYYFSQHPLGAYRDTLKELGASLNIGSFYENQIRSALHTDNGEIIGVGINSDTNNDADDTNDADDSDSSQTDHSYHEQPQANESSKQPQSHWFAAVYVKRRQRKTQRGNRMHVLTLNDESGSYEAVIFNETPDSMNHILAIDEQLENGLSAVCLYADIAMNGDRMRVSIRALMPMSVFIAKQCQCMEISLAPWTKLNDLQPLRDVISALQREDIHNDTSSAQSSHNQHQPHPQHQHQHAHPQGCITQAIQVDINLRDNAGGKMILTGEKITINPLDPGDALSRLRECPGVDGVSWSVGV